jgi:hypothetical protein
MNTSKSPTVRWAHVNDGMPNNAGRPWVGQGCTASYRIDGGDGWAVLSVYGDGWGHAAGQSLPFGSVASAKRAAARIEVRRQSEAVPA